MGEDYREYRAAAETIAAEAGALLREAYGHVSAREKGPADLVTDFWAVYPRTWVMSLRRDRVTVGRRGWPGQLGRVRRD